MPRPKRTPLQRYRQDEREFVAAYRAEVKEYRQLLAGQGRSKRDIIRLARRLRVEQLQATLKRQDAWWARHPEYKRYRERR